ncbi:hypothetical protein C819_03192 [Lachnospiraceae bacterium 10-1]|nr:hypothetical protein C819_03192 [Lachnospiraceae bacterium 10-1]
MKNKLTRNIGLKIASVFFAIILWMVVTSVNNPINTKTYDNIPVKLLNTELITESGQIYEVLEDTDVIGRVTIRAPRTVLSEIKEENVIATADVAELSSLDTISIKLTTNIANRDKVTSITGNIDTIKLNIENKRTKALALKSTVSGQVPEGYLTGDITTDQNLVRISGPQSIIDQIVKASVDVNVTGMTSDIVTNADIVFYDAEDRVVADTSSITQNIKSVGVKVSIWQTIDVPIIYNITGEAASGYRATGEINGNGEVVKIAGKSNALKSITEINIPAEALDISNQTEDYVADIDIRKYLPDGVFLANAEDALKTVTVYVAPEISKRLEIREEKVRIINLPEGYNASISGLEESFIIEVTGLSRDVAGLQANSIFGTVDIAEWMRSQGMDEPVPGYYTVEVDFGLSDDVALREPVVVTLHISEIEEA